MRLKCSFRCVIDHQRIDSLSRKDFRHDSRFVPHSNSLDHARLTVRFSNRQNVNRNGSRSQTIVSDCGNTISPIMEV